MPKISEQVLDSIHSISLIIIDSLLIVLILKQVFYSMKLKEIMIVCMLNYEQYRVNNELIHRFEVLVMISLVIHALLSDKFFQFFES